MLILFLGWLQCCWSVFRLSFGSSDKISFVQWTREAKSFGFCGELIWRVGKKEISAANNLSQHSRDGSKNIYDDDWLKQLSVYFGAFLRWAHGTASKEVCSLFGDLMEFSWNAFRSSMCAYVCARTKIKEFHDSQTPSAFHAPRTMIYDF